MASGKIYTRKTIAQILTLSERRVKQLVEEGVIEEFSPGHFKLLPAIQGYIGYLQSQIGDDDSTSNYNVEKARLTKLKREDAELDLQLRRNELHKSSDVEFIMTNMLVAFKAKLETLPHKVLPSLLSIPPGKEQTEHLLEVLKNAMNEALGELAGYSPELFDEDAYLDGTDTEGE